MRQIETQIRINAPAHIVWEILMDFENYSNWNPFIKQITGNSPSPQGAATVGENIEVLIFNGKKDFKFKPEILVVKKEEEFRWKGKFLVKGIFDGEHYFQLKEETSSRSPITEFVHGEKFTGILVGILMKSIGESTEEGFRKMNTALKEQAEIVYQGTLSGSMNV